MKFVNTKAIIALKDGMLLSLPFIMIGSLFLLLASFPIPAVANWMNQTGLTPFWNQAYNASFGIVSVFAVVGIAYQWAKNEGVEGLPAGMTAFVGFLILMNSTTPVMNGTKTVVSAQQAPTLLTGFIDRTWLGGQGMIAAIIVGLVTGWIYSWFVKRKITIKLPEQVPPAVANSFIALIPAAVLTALWLLVYIFFEKVAHTTLTQWIYATIQTPLQGITDSFGGILVLTLLVPFFWFFGVHGGLIVGSLAGPMLQANSFDNAQLYKAGKLTIANGAHVVTNEFYNNFINLTGSGITIGLIIFILIAAKSAQLRSIGKVELVPGIFNINEPFLFGLPIVMNPFLAIPFFLTPVVVAISTYFVIRTGIVPPLNGFACPWTMPAVISGFLIGGWKIWQACTLVISTLIYWPFARKYDKILVQREAATLKKDEAEGK